MKVFNILFVVAVVLPMGRFGGINITPKQEACLNACTVALPCHPQVVFTYQCGRDPDKVMNDLYTCQGKCLGRGFGKRSLEDFMEKEEY